MILLYINVGLVINIINNILFKYFNDLCKIYNFYMYIFSDSYQISIVEFYSINEISQYSI